MVKCELCGENVELYYESEGKKLCLSCFDNPERTIIKKKSDGEISIEEKKDDKVCSSCHKKVGFGKGKLEFIDEQGDEITLCGKCYNEIPKEEKLKLIVTSKKPFEINTGYITGGLIGGVLGGAAGGMGYKDGAKSAQDKIWKQYDLSFDEINKYSILNFNRHFLICSNDFRGKILVQMSNELKQKKQDEIARKIYCKNFNECERKEKREIKKEFKKMLKNNFEKNKDRGTLYG
jgi:hypothetical protein